MENETTIGVKIKVDSTEIETAIKKVDELIQKLEIVKELAHPTK